ncbi:NAD-dependent epimerase/dehydratase family protein [Streptomyces sp. ODS28]|uniref:NAD-dependent epimerase/dehydratase family protein n=1 Tax=Streptomyces sp. ODS28 TaxID=3136688 RepID=UPI0031EF749A
MRVLVLGSSGFLGGHVERALRAADGVRVLSGGRSPGACLRLDLATADPAKLAPQLRALGPDAVVNCAGTVGGDAATLAAVNARGPAVLCEALRRAAPAARLVHLGSAAEYGANDGRTPVPESAPAAPLGVYGATKLAGTLAVTGSGLDAVVLRVFDPVGPGAPAPSLPGRLAVQLRRALAAAGEGEPVRAVRVGDLSAHRDFVDVRDVARAVVRAVLRGAGGPGAEGVEGSGGADGPGAEAAALPRVLNIGSGTAHPLRMVAGGLARVAGYSGRIHESAPGADRAIAGGSASGGLASGGLASGGLTWGNAVSDGSASVPWQCADISAARAVLDWRPEITLGASLTALWQAARPNSPLVGAR